MDDGRLQQTTGGRRRAADTTRQRRGACAQPATDRVQLSAASHVASVRPCLATTGTDGLLHYAPQARRSRPHRNEGVGSPIERTDAATAAVPAARRTRPHFRVADVCAARRWPSPMRSSCSTGRESYAGCALGVAAPKCVSELFLLASMVAQSTNCGRSVMPLRKTCCVHDCQLLPILVTLSRCRALPWWDLDRTWPSALANHRAHCRPLVTAIGGSRERERGCSWRWSDQPSRPRLRRRQASPCRRASCCPPLKLATVHSILGVSLTMAVVRVRAAIRRDGRRAHELRLLAAMAQAHGGCDAVLRRGVDPTIRTWSNGREGGLY
jgi:hypothetical protein